MTPLPSFDPLAALEALMDAGVDFVVIGGVAARMYGSPTITRDLDICYDREQANLEKLSGVLVHLRARLRGVDDDVPFQLDARTLQAGGNFAFVTDAGELDILAVPAGTSGFRDLEKCAEEMDVDGLRVKVAALVDLIRMKQSAGRKKDLIEVEILSALLDEITAQER